MIYEQKVRRYCSEPIENIENYDKAVSSIDCWDCHHRLEITDNGRVSVRELKERNLYYHRPASELIFIPHGEHTVLHCRGIKRPEYVVEKQRKSLTGHKLSDETKRRMSIAQKGKKMPKTFCEKQSELKKGNRNVVGKKWYSNGKICVRAFTCPEGFHSGRK